MKKLLLLFVAFCGGIAFLFAQDVIILNNGDEIQALVQEIGSDEVTYQKTDNQSIATYTLKKSEIFMIKYANGSKEVFNDATMAISAADIVSLPMETEAMQKEFFAIGDNDAAMLKFLQKNDMRYYDSFNSACRMRNTGKHLLGAGIGVTLGGAILYISGAVLVMQYNVSGIGLVGFGIVGLVAGEVLTVASIPVSISAGIRKKNIKNRFSEQYFGVAEYSYQPTISFGFVPNGIGVKLNF
ncbi:MAG: hypothetical protein LBN23_03030 [Paludibacter sp.]|jgi:hypothetical protein|nr:hypothetical protein [Paludibacter sp.]